MTGRWSEVSLTLSSKEATYGDEQAERISVSAYVRYDQAHRPTPTGTVTITEGSKVLCVIKLSSGLGSCGLSATELPFGTYSVVATYSGDALYLGSSRAEKLVVAGPKATTTVLTLSRVTVTYGHENLALLSVTTKTQGIGSPTGTAMITEGSTVICTITLSHGTGSCGLATEELGVGVHNLVATYEASPPYLGSVGTATLTVVAGSKATTRVTRATMTSLKLSATRVAYGSEQLVRLSVLTLSHRKGTPTGAVTITEGSTVICTITLFDDDGWCRLSPKQLAVGSHDLVASYAGNSAYLPSSGSAKLTVTS